MSSWYSYEAPLLPSLCSGNKVIKYNYQLSTELQAGADTDQVRLDWGGRAEGRDVRCED